jgi:hypothetical protein
MSDKKKRVLWPLFLVAGLSLCAAAAVASRGPAATARVIAGATSAAPPLLPARIDRTRDRERLGYELITISRFGMEPAQIQRVGGHFFLSVENQARVQDIVLRLEPERGARVRELQLPNDQLDWTDELNLPAGRYVLTVVDHPRWICHINIEPR